MAIRALKRTIGPAVALALAVPLACLGTSVLAAPLPPAPPPVVLEWKAPRACPSVEDVRGEIGRMLAGSEADVTTPVRARAIVSRTTHWGWVLLLTTDTQTSHGERAIHADSCEALAGAAALILTLAVDPTRAESGIDTMADAGAVDAGDAAPEAAAPEAAAPPAAVVAEKPRLVTRHQHVAPPRAPPARRHAALSLAPTFDVGTLPSASFGATFGAAWTPPHARLEVSASLWAGQRVGLPTDATQGGLFQGWSAGARACQSSALGRFELGPCALLDIETMSATGYGTTDDTSVTNTWVAVGLGGFGAFAVSPDLAVRLSVDALFPVTPPQFFIYESTGARQTVYKPASLSGQASLGLEVRFF